MPVSQLRDEWEKETQATLGTREVGKLVPLSKVFGQRHVLAVMKVESAD